MPVWLQNPGAWIAIGVSLLFLVAAVVMHRVFLRVLKAGDPSGQAATPVSHDMAFGPASND